MDYRGRPVPPPGVHDGPRGCPADRCPGTSSLATLWRELLGRCIFGTKDKYAVPRPGFMRGGLNDMLPYMALQA